MYRVRVLDNRSPGLFYARKSARDTTKNKRDQKDAEEEKYAVESLLCKCRIAHAKDVIIMIESNLIRWRFLAYAEQCQI